jgi:endonuclease/exonuclease/phosphatase (EEP) superfamily protein YafD
MKIISWNLLRLVGASLNEVIGVINREQPDLLLMQEVTHLFDGLTERVGGYYWHALLPGRIHGLAIWSRAKPPAPAVVVPLQSGAMFRRVGMVLDVGPFSVANVHLSHGQVLNRRQLRRVVRDVKGCVAVLGDYNLVGPTMLPGFRDVGPRAPTHVCGDLVPLRIDRCMVRGLECRSPRVLPRLSSDHRPIVVNLTVAGATSALAA